MSFTKFITFILAVVFVGGFLFFAFTPAEHSAQEIIVEIPKDRYLK